MQIERIGIKIDILKPFKSGRDKNVDNLNKHNIVLSKYIMQIIQEIYENPFVLNRLVDHYLTQDY